MKITALPSSWACCGQCWCLCRMHWRCPSVLLWGLDIYCRCPCPGPCHLQSTLYRSSTDWNWIHKEGKQVTEGKNQLFTAKSISPRLLYRRQCPCFSGWVHAVYTRSIVPSQCLCRCKCYCKFLYRLPVFSHYPAIYFFIMPNIPKASGFQQKERTNQWTTESGKQKLSMTVVFMIKFLSDVVIGLFYPPTHKAI